MIRHSAYALAVIAAAAILWTAAALAQTTTSSSTTTTTSSSSTQATVNTLSPVSSCFTCECNTSDFACRTSCQAYLNFSTRQKCEAACQQTQATCLANAQKQQRALDDQRAAAQQSSASGATN